MGRYDYGTCKTAIESIITGNATLGEITNKTIGKYIWNGPVQGLNPGFPRSEYLVITYEGCKRICGNKVALNDAPKALNIAATWIFPLAILLNLPYDSLHSRKNRGTLESVSNWLGSPQTALTATIFNFRQIRDCHRRVKEFNRDMQPTASDAYYTLSCMNQFDLPQDIPTRQRMMHVLIYGLFRPLSVDAEDIDVVLLKQMLSAMAHQLRMQRRKGVIPTLSSLGTFLIAFIFSVVLAFGEMGDNTTAHSLALGLLVSWLPLLVIFTIVDRNPISADRSAELMSRWLHNVDAIRRWKLSKGNYINDIAWWDITLGGQEPFQIGRFIGQGRRMQYCGLTSSVILETTDYKSLLNGKGDISLFDAIADRVSERLQRKATSWLVVAFISLVLVLLEVMMAFMIAFITPTVGLGCRSFSYGMFAILSSFSWCFNIVVRTPPKAIQIICHSFNALAILALTAIIGFQLTGGMNNCWCMASMFNVPFGLGGYTDFENGDFYMRYTNVQKFWAVGTAFGGIIPLVALIVAIFWWLKCQHLWSANDRTHASSPETHKASTEWLR
ncbi:hypothetical protein B0O99DRAFT_588020 [Bisporella sp. PMI_857]|nr:hypothetical protein B0O99DRAFT_588020 [Bisporella sp. PMI_857]